MFPAFRRILQVLHLDVSKVDRVLQLSPHFSVALHRCLFLLWRRLGIRRPLSLFFSMLVTLGLTWTRVDA